MSNRSRSQFVLSAVRICGFTVLIFCGVTIVSAAKSAVRPNVLFIAVDDLNDWNSPLGGHEGVQTPNIERLATRGLTFTRAYCSAPACNPSRASLLCGKLPSTSGVYHNSQPWRPAMPDAVTLPQHFMANGYHVEGGGKIFHGSFPDRASWHAYFNPKGKPKNPDRPANGIPKAGNFDWGPVDISDDEMPDGKVAGWAVDFLGHKQDKPFFLAVGFFKPHLPWYVPRKYFELYPLDRVTLPKVLETDLDDVPPIGRRIAGGVDHRRVIESNNWAKAVQGYLASITFVDVQIGQVLDALDKSPYAQNTVIVLWSDHGWHLGQKHHWRKFALWEEATRVAFMVTAPGVTKPGSRCGRTVSLLDMYPTLTELCGLPAREGQEGVSLVPLLREPETKWDRPAVMTHGFKNHAVRSERWRYIRYADGTEELYDHEADPLEWKNLAGNADLAEVKRSLAAHLPTTNTPAVGKAVEEEQ